MVDVSAAERTAERAVVLLLHGACVALVACAPFLFAGSAEAQQARTESQINTLTDAERAAAAEQGRVQRERFLTPGSGYQPGNAQMFNTGNH